jgi:DNA-binding response OmpR family regulator
MASSDPAPAPQREKRWPAEAVVLAHEAPVRIGPLTIDPAMRRVVHDDGQEAFLQPRVMQALVALVRADGQILSRDDLMAQCWSGMVVGEDAINRVMARLRRRRIACASRRLRPAAEPVSRVRRAR